ncbi:MAG: enoyl-CoA hydratase [Phreatobacter sp.]|uniref:enoyl-CoA hydratase n=1 Tax=Phreatobacter sp. TaxID=1966341 RepID=UPI00273654E6|nr:enoyl-CoA hydratase [Phreatobacter sp.]MDP2800333.1 enoyl-CoA hydratase [Phreatobacter sp.]
MTELLIERHGPVAVLVLNRPQAMNALSQSLIRSLTAAVAALGRDETARVLVLTGAGEHAFSAGLDLKELGASSGLLGMVEGGGERPNPIRAIEQCPKPVIAAVNGVAITGGFELALACDILIAAETARFADTHQRVGVIPGWGLSQKLARIIGPSRAKEMAFSGRFVTAPEASAWGLVSRTVPPGDLMAEVLALAGEIAEVDAGFLADYKRLMNEGYDLPFGEAMALEAEWSRRHNSALAPNDLAARREGVQSKGRSR